MADEGKLELLSELVKTQRALIEKLEAQVALTTRQRDRAKELARREGEPSSPHEREPAAPKPKKRHAEPEDGEARKKRTPKHCRSCNTEYTTFSCPSIECQEKLAERKRQKKEQAKEAPKPAPSTFW